MSTTELPVAFRQVAFLDLKAQQKRISADLRARLDRGLEHCQFVLGPEVAELESALAAFCGAKKCNPCLRNVLLLYLGTVKTQLRSRCCLVRPGRVMMQENASQVNRGMS